MSKLILLAITLWATPSFAEAPAPVEEAPVEEAPAEDAPAEDAPEAEEVVVEVPADEAEAVSDAVEAVDALQKGKYATFGALLMGLMVFLWNKFAPAALRRKDEE